MMASDRAVRIYPELRAAQVSREPGMTTAQAWFFSANYDLAVHEVPAGFIPMTTWRAVRTLASRKVHVLEVPELLWARELPRTLVLLLVHKICSPRLSRRVFYAIENNSPQRALFGSKRLPKPVVSAACAAVGAAASVLVDRIAFGSRGAELTYLSLPFLRRVRRTLIEELPGRPEAPPVLAEDRDGMVFVGAVEARKGIKQLLGAWELVEQAIPDGSIQIIGDGVLANEVAEWASRDTVRRTFVGRLPHEDVVRAIGRSSVLVAPSQRSGRWREQIGLPIKEALSAGTTVVTTTETGLAAWLAAHGHFVLGDATAALASTIEAAMRHPLDPAEVVAALPAKDGRVTADRWLHDDQESMP